jgi:hypothetical protein
VSASQARNLKGRPKTDKLDAMWLARLTRSSPSDPRVGPFTWAFVLCGPDC